jgi:alpha-D-ribose 1-methylphosphonate 5-triphosphate synthase subunit PhnH
VDSLTGGQPVIFTGPGILGEIHIAPVVPENFWDEWRKNHQAYPLGIDIFLMTETEVMGLPRTTAVEKLR